MTVLAPSKSILMELKSDFAFYVTLILNMALSNFEIDILRTLKSDFKRDKFCFSILIFSRKKLPNATTIFDYKNIIQNFR